MLLHNFKRTAIVEGVGGGLPVIALVAGYFFFGVLVNYNYKVRALSVGVVL